MGLNENVMDDLDDNPIVDNDIVVQPSPIVNKKDDITIIPETDEVKAQGVMSEEELQKLTQMDVTFKLVEDGQAKIAELKDVEADIISQESISRHSAEYIGVAFEDFLKGPVRLVEFTQSPSKTNYDYALRHMANRIAKEEVSLVANFQLLIDQPINDAKALLQQFSSSYVQAVQSRLFSLRGKVLGLAEKLQSSKDMVLPYGDGFVNVTQVDLKSFEVDKLGEVNIDRVSLKASVESLKLLLKCPHLNALVWTVIEGKGYDNVKNPETRLSYQGCAVTIMDLLKFFNSDVDAMLHSIAVEAEQALGVLINIQEQSDQHKQNMKAITEFINVSMVPIQENMKAMTRYCHVVNDLSCLVFTTGRLVEFYDTL